MGDFPVIDVVFTNDVVNYMIENVESPRVLARLEKQREMLAYFPEMGHVYCPSYEAAQPPFPCRWIAVPDTPFTLYYHYDEKEQTVVVFYMEHQREDPKNRFVL